MEKELDKISRNELRLIKEMFSNEFRHINELRKNNRIWITIFLVVSSSIYTTVFTFIFMSITSKYTETLDSLLNDVQKQASTLEHYIDLAKDSVDRTKDTFELAKDNSPKNEFNNKQGKSIT